MICVVSTDKKFAEMLVIELEAAGFSAERSEGFPKKHTAALTVADLDTCGAIPSGCRNLVGFSRHSDPNGAEFCMEVLKRPFSVAGLCALAASVSGTSENTVKLSQKKKNQENLLLNPDNCSCFIGDSEVILTPSEYTVLSVIAENSGRVVSAAELMSAVGGDGNILRVYICGIRRKLSRVSSVRIIKTVHGKGYSL